MPRIQNPSPEEKIIPGYPSFAPGEVREVSEEDAVYLTNGSGIVRVEDEPPVESPKKRPRPSDPDND